MIQKKKFVKTFRNTKTVQLILLLLLETAYVLVLTLNPALGTKLFEDRTLFILCTLSWILALFNLIWLLYDFYKLRTFCRRKPCSEPCGLPGSSDRYPQPARSGRGLRDL